MGKELCVPDEIAAIRADIYVHGGATAGTLARIESLVHRFPDSPDLWVLRGDAIQLGDGSGPSLDEARKSYEHALAIDSGHREADEHQMKSAWRTFAWFVTPVLLVLIGIVWMSVVTAHYERATGREFYGLAAVMHSVPDWGTTYRPGGHEIERWAVNVPAYTTLILLLCSAVAVVVLHVRAWPAIKVAGIFVWHIVVGGTFVLVAGWFAMNITGVFI